ncbi:hypothetical protein [Nonomuraea sp. NPDC050786]|uniref:hypothetical protein n=1 Tax=Nonomuraea sp. NPDC050786 TaxID=3154840 RepID=UPI0033FF1E72
MRRYRFGRIAALLATGYVLVAVAFGVIALVTGDPRLLRQLVVGDWDPFLMPFTWWLEIVLVAGGILQGWAYWQVLRGRSTGEPPAGGRRAGLLRAALYLGVASTLLFQLPIPYQWWLGLPGGLLHIAVVWLFFLVLAGVLPRWLRIVALVAGLVDAAVSVADTVAVALGQYDFLAPLQRPPLLDAIYLVWLVPVLAGQSRDPRWSRGTVVAGAVSAAVSLSLPRSSMYASIGGRLDPTTVVHTVVGLLGVFGMVWAARSAHELGGPPQAVPPSRAPATRAARRPWPLAAVAVVLPLIPAAFNVADGMPVWTGPRGVVEHLFGEYLSQPARLLWVGVDLLVGVGAPAVLVLVAVVRRTRRLLRVTMSVLVIAAAAGVASALTTRPETDLDLFPDMVESRLSHYPPGLFDTDGSGRILFGLSPLWYSAALAASALVLFLLYAAPPAARMRRHVLVTALATSVALCFLPAADHSRGPVTTAADCSPQKGWRLPQQAEPQPRKGTRAYICSVRGSRALPFADTTPDQVLLAHGRRLCGAYTRNDPAELARIRAVEKVDVRDLEGVLAPICPPADVVVQAEVDEEDREYEEWEAEEQRKCDATPRHRPRIRPAKAIRLKEPEWPEAGLELYEPTEGSDPANDGVYGAAPANGLVSVGPSHVMVDTHSDFHVCVTLETYTRRPPVETKGWEHVVEVGYESPEGQMVFMDGLSGTELPDLSLNGRKGHYRIRVHFAWFPWKGDEYGTQRLLIMAYPGEGDKIITYRKPAKPRS